MMNQVPQEFSVPFTAEDLLLEAIEHVNSEEIANSLYVNPNEIFPNDSFNNVQYESSSEDSKPVYIIPETIPDSTQVDVLSNKEYSGPYNFDVFILPNDKSKNPWVYSSVLNKVYMDISQQFPVDFRLSHRPDQPLFIRITPQYSEQQYARELVCRCIQHEYHGDPTNKGIPEHVRQHVIRCSNVIAQYVGNIAENKRLSILILLTEPQVGNESVREFFQFVCLSSCNAPGMSRREIELIFTLEDEHAVVYGRKSLKVRICACPKRDKENEEKKGSTDKTNVKVPKGKKRKADPPVPTNSVETESQQGDFNVYKVSLQLTGKENALKLLNYAQDIYQAKAYQLRGQSGEELMRKNLDLINEEIKKVQSSSITT